MPVSERVEIRKPDGHNLVGILERPDASASPRALPGTRRQPIALILHGLLAHKDQIYHRRLAKELLEEGMPSFRYDLTGQGGESDGKFGLSNFEDDADDLELVIDWLAQRDYAVLMIVAHSRGTFITSLYLSTRPHRLIPLYASVSARWDFTRIARDSPYSRGLGDKDAYDWDVRVAGKNLTMRVTRDDVTRFAHVDNSFVTSRFPQDVHVLTMHGLADKVIPHTDADKFNTIFAKRSPGTSELVKVEGAGHNWEKPFDEPVRSIMDWFRRRRGEAERALSEDLRRREGARL